MAFTVARVNGGENVFGRQRAVVADLTFDNSYNTGGEAISAAELGLQTVFGMMFIGGNAAAAVLQYWYDTTNKKIIVLFPTGGATAAPTTLANPISTTGASTASAVDATTPNITPGKAKEVGSTTDLSTVTIRVIAFGI